MPKCNHPNNFTTIYVLLCLSFYSCGDQEAQNIVDAAIERHGGKAYQSFEMEFDFRNMHYTASRKGGLFTYTREFTDSTGSIKDVLNNTGLIRYHNDSILSISGERRAAFSRSVNSVIYFALLPFGLNDDAVNKAWIAETTIKGESYDVIRITFDKQGGGDDHEDVFLYWIHQKNNTMDYLAYSYETDGGGLRFREAINPRNIGGIRFQDYVNYKPQDESIPLEILDSLFVSGKLKILSQISLENLQVSPFMESD